LDKELLQRKITELSLSTVKTLANNMNIHGALIIMQKENIGSVVIVDKTKVVGIITERDIVMKVAGITDEYKKTLVTEIMTPDPRCVSHETRIGEVIDLIVDGNFRHLPVVDNHGEAISMVSVKDVMKFIKDNG